MSGDGLVRIRSFFPLQRLNHWPETHSGKTFMLQQTADKDQICNMRHENYAGNMCSYKDHQRAGKKEESHVDNENTVGLYCLCADRQEQ